MQAHCLGELRRRARGVAVFAQCQTKAEMGFGNFGLQTHGLRIMSFGFRALAQLVQSQAEIDAMNIGIGKGSVGVVGIGENW